MQRNATVIHDNHIHCFGNQKRERKRNYVTRHKCPVDPLVQPSEPQKDVPGAMNRKSHEPIVIELVVLDTRMSAVVGRLTVISRARRRACGHGCVRRGGSKIQTECALVGGQREESSRGCAMVQGVSKRRCNGCGSSQNRGCRRETHVRPRSSGCRSATTIQAAHERNTMPIVKVSRLLAAAGSSLSLALVLASVIGTLRGRS